MRYLASSTVNSGLVALALTLTLGAGAPLLAQDCATGRTAPALVAGDWTMVSLPCDPTLATVEGVWGDDFDPAEYDNPGQIDLNPTWVVWERDEATGTNLHLALTDTLGGNEGVRSQEQSYWVLSTVGGAWTVDGAETPVTLGIFTCGFFVLCYEVDVMTPAAPGGSQMDLLSNPFPNPVPWSDIAFGVGGLFTSGESPSQAAANGRIVNAFHIWNGPFASGSYQTGTDGDTIPAFSGFWLETTSPDWLGGLTLVNITQPPAPLQAPPLRASPLQASLQTPGQADTAAVSLQRAPSEWRVGNRASRGPGALAASEWEVRLIVATPDESLRDPGNLLGQLNGSGPGLDSKDLKALDPFSAPYLDLVFPHDDWGDDVAKEYNRDYHGRSGGRMDVWQFIVKSDDPDRDIVLSWEGEKKMRRMWLRDDLTGELIKAKRKGVLQTYSFNMEGALERSFSWVIAANRR